MFEVATHIPLINPFVLYGACALGALGVLLALPRRRVNPQALGAVLAGIAAGAVLIGLGLGARANAPDPDRLAPGVEISMLPNVYFYVFAAIALGASLRVVTHRRPVYAALYFILTILASCGLYLILSAEFMAFALVIIYAGAILITYLFVIMLATQAPSEEQPDALADYDASAREPAIASVVGFVLLAALSTMMFEGVRILDGRSEAKPSGNEQAFRSSTPDEVLARLPLKVEKALREAELIDADQSIDRGEKGASLWAPTRTATVNAKPGADADLDLIEWPEDLAPTNTEMVGFDLLAKQPGAIEIAGVILLMAMLGATVLSRRQVEQEEEAKAEQAAALGSASAGSASMGGGGS